MRYLPEIKPFRDTFVYNNYIYMLLGHVAEKLGGDKWEALLKSKLLEPLGMSRTRVLHSPADLQAGNVAQPYILSGGKIQNGTRSIYRYLGTCTSFYHMIWFAYNGMYKDTYYERRFVTHVLCLYFNSR